MKKTILLVFFLYTAICAFPQSEDAGLFKIVTNTVDDIEGLITTSRMNILNVSEASDSSAIKFTLCKRINPDNRTVVYMEIIYTGKSWRYIDTLIIKADDKLFYKAPTTYDRKQGNEVTEIYNVFLTSEAKTALQSCGSIILQVNGTDRGKPYSIAMEGMKIINDFMKN